MNRNRARTWLFAGSIAFAFLLQLMPLPQLLLPLKPYWVGLVLIYWAIETPERVGLGFAFLIGLAGDLLSGELLAEQALRLVLRQGLQLLLGGVLYYLTAYQLMATTRHAGVGGQVHRYRRGADAGADPRALAIASLGDRRERGGCGRPGPCADAVVGQLLQRDRGARPGDGAGGTPGPRLRR